MDHWERGTCFFVGQFVLILFFFAKRVMVIKRHEEILDTTKFMDR